MSQDFMKSRSQLVVTSGVRTKKRDKDEENQNGYDLLDPSEIELEIDEEARNVAVEENFLETEYQVGVCPF